MVVSAASSRISEIPNAETPSGLLLALPDGYLAQKVSKYVGDLHRLDYLRSIRDAADVSQILTLMQQDPWTDERIAARAFERMLESTPGIPLPAMACDGSAKSRKDSMELVRGLDIVLFCMGSHIKSQRVQKDGCTLICRALRTKGYRQNNLTETIDPVMSSPSLTNSLVRAICLHARDEAIQAAAFQALAMIRIDLHATYFQSLMMHAVGGSEGISIFFQALHRFPSNGWIVYGVLSLLQSIDERSHRESLIQYTRDNPEWHPIITGTIARSRPVGVFLSQSFSDF